MIRKIYSRTKHGVHSQALIVQDGPLASLFGVSVIIRIQTRGSTPLDE
jgi:hypothetical protein